MRQRTTIINAEKLFGNLCSIDGYGNTADDYETHWEWPEEIGSGIVSTINIRSGINLVIGNFRLRENISIIHEQFPRLLIFGYGILGSIRYVFDFENVSDVCWCYEPGCCHTAYIPQHGQGIVNLSTMPQTYYVYIYVDPLILKALIDGQHNQLPIGMRNIINGAEEQHFHQALIMPPAGNMAIRQIINCPYQSSFKRLFLESKVLELISYSLAQLVSRPEAIFLTDELLPVDIKHVMDARDILTSNLENPPSLLDLAKQVGTNKTKLNKGFRQFFGTSTFEYLRIRRLEKAKALLESKEMNVSEVAVHVGYAHQTSFTRAFKNHFGTYPTAHLH